MDVALIGEFGGPVAVLIAYVLLRSYLKEKGKNLATKEDIAFITNSVESVRTEHAKVLEEVRTGNQLKLAEIAREKDIRKEVYLGALEGITKAHNALSRLPNLNLNGEDISVSAADSAIIGKVQVVGSETTVKAVTAIMGAIGTAYMELILERGTLVDRKNQIEQLATLRAKAEDELSRYLAMMKDANLQGNTNQQFWDAINRQVQFETQQRDTYAHEIARLGTIQQQELLAFANKCFDRSFAVSELFPNAILSVRAELGLPISEEAYLGIFRENNEKGRRVVSQFFESIENNQQA